MDYLNLSYYFKKIKIAGEISEKIATKLGIAFFSPQHLNNIDLLIN